MFTVRNTIAKYSIIALSLMVLFIPYYVNADTVVDSQSVIDGTAEVVTDSIWVQHDWVAPVTTTIYSIITYPSDPGSDCIFVPGTGARFQSGINANTLNYPDPVFGSPSLGTSTKLASGACMFTQPTGFNIVAGTSYNIFFGASGQKEEYTPMGAPKGSISNTISGEAGHMRSNSPYTYRRDDTQIADMAFVLCSTPDCHDPNPAPDTSTHIISVTPSNNAVISASTSTTSTLVTFNIRYYINAADIGGLTTPAIHVTMHNTDQNVLISRFSANDIDLFDFYATSSGEFSATTTIDLPQGNYRTTSILESYLASFGIPFTKEYDRKYSQFIVGHSTVMGNLSRNGFDTLQTLLGATTSSTTINLTEDCGPLSSGFDFGKCLGDLFIPQGNYIASTTEGFKQGVAKKFPWGYFTRFYAIVTDTTTAGLPTFSPEITMGTNGNLSTTTLTFDMDDMLIGGADLVDSIHDPYHNMTARDIFYPMIQLVINIGVILTIFVDLTGSHRHHVNQANGDTGETKKKKLS